MKLKGCEREWSPLDFGLCVGAARGGRIVSFRGGAAARRCPLGGPVLSAPEGARRVQADSLGHPVTKLFVILAAFLSVSMLVLDTGLQRRGVATMVGFADDLDVESTTVS